MGYFIDLGPEQEGLVEYPNFFHIFPSWYNLLIQSNNSQSDQNTPPLPLTNAIAKSPEASQPSPFYQLSTLSSF